MDNAADVKQIRKAEKAAALAERQGLEVVKGLMSTINGRRWVWDQLAASHVFSSTFTGDALQSAFAEGQRTGGLRLLAQVIQAAPDDYIQAMREANERDHTDNQSSRSTPTELSGGEDAGGDDQERGEG